MFGLNEIKIVERRYYPMVVSEQGTEDKMSLEEDRIVWDMFDALPQERRDSLLSGEMPKKLKLLQEKLKLNDITIGNISLIVRKIFFGAISVSELGEKIKSIPAIVGNDLNKTETIVEYIQKEILTIKPKVRVEEEEKEAKKSQPIMMKMPLLQALSKYESLGNQLITEERIRIKSQSEPVRPSLLYWVKYYRDELGIGHHDSVQRGNFLFRSENGKRLSGAERERVNLVLKSVEENFPLEIDTARQEILFPAFVSVPQPAPRMESVQNVAVQREEQIAEKFQPRANPAFNFGQGGMVNGMAAPAPLQHAPASQGSGGEISFSSKHVFPAEKKSEVRESIPAPTPPAPRTRNPFQIRPVSMGKEE